MGDARGVRHATLALVLAACGDAASTDVTGPYTGAHHRFVVDAVSLPRDVGAAMDALWFADSLHTTAFAPADYARLSWWRRALAWTAFRLRRWL